MVPVVWSLSWLYASDEVLPTVENAVVQESTINNQTIETKATTIEEILPTENNPIIISTSTNEEKIIKDKVIKTDVNIEKKEEAIKNNAQEEPQEHETPEAVLSWSIKIGTTNWLDTVPTDTVLDIIQSWDVEKIEDNKEKQKDIEKKTEDLKSEEKKSAQEYTNIISSQWWQEDTYQLYLQYKKNRKEITQP